MKIAIGSDHAGFALKQTVLPFLRERYELTDVGSYDENPVDFPDVAGRLCEALISGAVERGVMFCGTGAGAAIACNKVPGIRAAVCHDAYTAHQCVEHDDVQVMALGAQVVGPTVAEELIVQFLNAHFSGTEEFCRRIQKLDQMEKGCADDDALTRGAI